MAVLIAVAHFAGALVTVAALGIAMGLAAASQQERVTAKLITTAALDLNLTVAELSESDNSQKLNEWAARRYSSELLRNRVSDLLGLVRTTLGILWIIAQAIVLIGVGWKAFTEDVGAAVNVWWIVAISLASWITNVLFTFACALLTGRYPGQARAARKALGRMSGGYCGRHRDGGCAR